MVCVFFLACRHSIALRKRYTSGSFSSTVSLAFWLSFSPSCIVPKTFLINLSSISPSLALGSCQLVWLGDLAVIIPIPEELYFRLCVQNQVVVKLQSHLCMYPSVGSLLVRCGCVLVAVFFILCWLCGCSPLVICHHACCHV